MMPRYMGNVIKKLLNMLLIALCAILGGCAQYVETGARLSTNSSSPMTMISENLLATGDVLNISISYAPNIWSGPAILLSDGRRGLTNGVNMPRGILSAHSPLTATLSQLGLYIVYTLPLALLYFALTINMRRAYAFAIPVLLHALMLIVFMDGIYARYSLFSYLFLSCWLEWSAPYRAYFICVCVCAALSALIIGARGARRMDVHNLAILWLK